MSFLVTEDRFIAICMYIGATVMLKKGATTKVSAHSTLHHFTAFGPDTYRDSGLISYITMIYISFKSP